MDRSDKMSDIVETLRVAAKHPYNQHGPYEFLTEAADEITRLRAENEKLRERLELWRIATRAAYALHGQYQQQEEK